MAPPPQGANHRQRRGKPGSDALGEVLGGRWGERPERRGGRPWVAGNVVGSAEAASSVWESEALPLDRREAFLPSSPDDRPGSPVTTCALLCVLREPGREWSKNNVERWTKSDPRRSWCWCRATCLKLSESRRSPLKWDMGAPSHWDENWNCSYLSKMECCL